MQPTKTASKINEPDASLLRSNIIDLFWIDFWLSFVFLFCSLRFSFASFNYKKRKNAEEKMRWPSLGVVYSLGNAVVVDVQLFQANAFNVTAPSYHTPIFISKFLALRMPSVSKIMITKCVN